jgi:hypothetical protein
MKPRSKRKAPTQPASPPPRAVRPKVIDIAPATPSKQASKSSTSKPRKLPASVPRRQLAYPKPKAVASATVVRIPQLKRKTPTVSGNLNLNLSKDANLKKQRAVNIPKKKAVPITFTDSSSDSEVDTTLTTNPRPEAHARSPPWSPLPSESSASLSPAEPIVIASDIESPSSDHDKQKKRKRKQPAAAPISEALEYEFPYQAPNADEGDASSSPDDKVPPPSRKVVAKPETWIRNTRVKTLVVSEKPPCSCTLKCFERIGRSRRKDIRAAFSKLDLSQQKEHMAGLIDLHKVVFKGPALQIARKRQQKQFTALYHIKTNHKRERVCNKAFLAFLGIGGRRVKNLNRYRWSHPKNSSAVPPDLRGKHTSRPNRIPDEIVKQVDDHIASFPRESSHYALKTEKKFLSSDLSCRKMHRLYLQKHEPGIVPHGGDSSDSEREDSELDMEEEKEEDAKPLVTYAFYTGRFNTFDLSFAKPEVDSCATCDELKIQLSAAVDEDAADALRAQRKLHLLEADRGYAMRKHDHELAEASRKSEPGPVPSELDHNSWDGVEFVCSDMAGVLITPKVSVNKAFYLRKMNTYCYGLFSGQASQHSLCFWNETVARKGSNEVLSSAHEFFMKRKTGATRLNWVHSRSPDLCCAPCIVPVAHAQFLSYTAVG